VMSVGASMVRERFLGLMREECPSGAKEASEKGQKASEKPEKHTSGAEARAHSADFIPGINPRPTARTSFSAACEAHADSADFIPGINPRPTARTSFSAACEAHADSAGFIPGINPRPTARTSFSAGCGVCCLFLLAVAWLPCLCQVATPAPKPVFGQYRIAGRVVNAVTDEPVRRATVSVRAVEDSHIVESAESDSGGRFALEGLPAAKYQLSASKRGYRTSFYDEHDEFSSAIVTGEGKETRDLRFMLTPGSTLRGVVTGDGGDPVEGAKVMLFLKPHSHAPGERITQVDSAVVDDTGAYEFSSLAAGEYLLAVKAEPWYAIHTPGSQSRSGGDPSAALDVAYPLTFFDSTTEEASATNIVLAGGSREMANINLHAVPALHIAVEAPHGQDGPLAWPELRQTIFGTQVAAESQHPPNDPQARTVEFTGVAPGHYELVQGVPPRIVEVDATTSQQVDPSVGTPTVAVKGTLRNVSGSVLPDVVTLTLSYRDGAHPQDPMVTNSSNGQFRFDAVPPGTWEMAAVSSGSPPAIVSITVDNRIHPGNLVTVRDRAQSVVVSVSQEETSVQGFVRKDGKGVAGVMVVLVPKEKALFEGLVRRDQSDSDGSFALPNVVPGQYTVVAIEEGWDLDWARAEIIGRLIPKGVAVTVTESSGKVVQLAVPVSVQRAAEKGGI
jgi:hypothetical protein